MSGETLKSFDEFLERRFPESRRKAHYPISIHEHLPPEVRRELKEEESGMGEGAGAGEGSALGGSAVRLRNLVAQSPLTAERGV
jgi:hypothetical protein